MQLTHVSHHCLPCSVKRMTARVRSLSSTYLTYIIVNFVSLHIYYFDKKGSQRKEQTTELLMKFFFTMKHYISLLLSFFAIMTRDMFSSFVRESVTKCPSDVIEEHLLLVFYEIILSLNSCVLQEI